MTSMVIAFIIPTQFTGFRKKILHATSLAAAFSARNYDATPVPM